MARKKKHPEHVNHERWLISYADFITLLFAFFVVMFAVSQVDSKKVGRFSEAFSKAVGADMFPDKGTGFLPEAAPAEKPKPETSGNDGTGGAIGLPKELIEVKKAIEKKKDESALVGLQVVTRRNELVLRMADNIFFDPGNDTLKQPAVDILKTLAPELIKRNVDVRIEGHTDARPISTVRFHSNWDLSTARATAVIMRLAADGMPPARLAAAGYGEFRPIAPNDTDEGRRQNRRVDLVISMAAPPEAADLVNIAPKDAKDAKDTTKDAPAGSDAKDAPKDAPKDAKEEAKEPTTEAAPAKESKEAKDPKDAKEIKPGKQARHGRSGRGKPAFGVAEADDGNLKELPKQP
jgi:chemotaxis protein MotB